MRFILCYLCLLLAVKTISAELTVSSSCQTHCGEIAIRYPFGIGEGCYHNEWYEVSCNDFVPFLPKIKKEVVQIDLPRPFEHDYESFHLGSLRIKTSVTSMGCNGGNGEKSEELLNFTGTPFSISADNILVAFGCNSKAALTHIDPRIVGCVATCDLKPLIIPPQTSPTSCYGYKCCSASIPEEVGQVIGVKIERNDGNRTGCRVAFLTDEDNQSSSSWGNTTRQYSTVQLKWKILTMDTSFQESLKCGDISLSVSDSDDFHSRPCYCDGVDIFDNPVHLWCACTSGYEGNPYLPGECKDIDECAQGRPYDCSSGETCQNIPGSHRCVIKKSKTFLIYIGVSVGLSVLLVGAAIWVYKQIKKHRKMKVRKSFFKRNGGLLLQQQLTSGEGSVEKTRVFSSKELEKATESFSPERVLGQGGQGTVYKGMLADGRIVAVKKATVLDEDKVGEFVNELVILSQLNHRNIVRIYGCCLETEVPVLVYEFVPNGNLFQHLHEELGDHSMTTSTWEVRLRIAIDISSAISYLHSWAASPIYHKDVKSTNIMIDEKGRAKLSDFGTSRVIAVDHTHLTTVVSGTRGYVDPVYFQSSRYTEKSDVYSYGIVLAELITGERPVSLQRSEENRTLATYFLVAMKENRLSDIIDPRIKGDCSLEQITVMAEIATLCLSLTGEKRPTMREISRELEKISSSHPEVEDDEIKQVHFNIAI